MYEVPRWCLTTTGAADLPTGPVADMGKGTCSTEGCGKVDRLRRGKCYKHYWEEHGPERETCTDEDGCDRPASRRGLCGKHYGQWRVLNGPPCKAERCPKVAIAQGYCQDHWRKWRKYGDPLACSPRQKCAWPDGCGEEVVVSRSSSGLCKYHAAQTWKKAHPENVNASNRRYNAAHAEQAKTWRKKWLDGHPEFSSEAAARRRTRLLGQFVEDVQRGEVFRRDKGICGICRKRVDPADWHLDHIVPISQGGEHSYANVQVSHPYCNESKGAKLIEHQMRLL